MLETINDIANIAIRCIAFVAIIIVIVVGIKAYLIINKLEDNEKES